MPVVNGGSFGDGGDDGGGDGDEERVGADDNDERTLGIAINAKSVAVSM